MKSFFRNLSSRFPFFANRPSALERAVRQSPKSRRLRMEPLENRALLAVDAFGGAASLIDSDVGATWGPDPAPAAFSASVLATDAAIVDVSAVGATLADAPFSVQVETPEPVAPPSFEQLMETLGQVKIESLGDESDAASLSYLDEAASATQLLNSLNLQDISQGTPRQVVFYDSSDADFDESTLNLDDESVYYVDVASANGADAESYSATPRSGGGSNSGGSGGSSNSGGSTSVVPSDYQFTTYGSTTIFESATYDSSGGSNQGPFFAFTTPASIPSGYEAFVRFEANGAIYGHDYYVMTANIVDGVATPQYSYYYHNTNRDDYDLYVSGGTSYCIIPMNDNVLEAAETLVATFYLVNTNSGGADYDPTPVACGSFNATIIDDDASFSVYWRDNSSASGAPLSGNPNGGGSRFFPEQTDPNASSLKNKVDLVFKLNAPSDENLTIYYRLFDPDNNISLGCGQPSDSVFAGGDNNNQNGFDELSYGFSANAVSIPAGATEYALTLTLSDAYAGDNFIVVAGQDPTTVAAAELGTTATTRYEVVQPTDATEFSKLAQTQNLTVWRTLWVECDQMRAPVPPTLGNPASDGFTLSTDFNSGAYTGPNCWSVVSPVAPISGESIESHDFDFLTRPLAPNIALLTQEMRAACVKTRQITDAELKEWLNTETLLTADFRRHLTFNTTALSQTQRDTITGRDLPISYNQEAFWLVHALGAFDIDDEINDSSSSNIDRDNWFNNNLESVGFTGYASGHSILLYNEMARDFLEWNKTAEDRANFRDLDDALAVLMLHETLHYFLGPHTAARDSVSDVGIMGYMDQVFLRDSSPALSAAQIQKLQSKSRCEQDGIHR